MDQRIISWTLAGPGTAPIIGDALRSVMPIADACAVIWTGCNRSGADATWGAAFDVLRAEDSTRRHLWQEWAWCDNFGAARTAALDIVRCEFDERDWVRGAWSTMVDTDERVVCPDPGMLRRYLSFLCSDVVVVLAQSEEGTHTRERFFRHPNPGRFVGRTHEQFRARDGGTHAIVPREIVYWTEIPKTPEQLAAKGDRDVAMLRADLADEPTNGAAWFYLGSTLQNLGRHQEAIDAWRECIKHDMREGGAWAAFKAGESYLEIGEPDRAIDCALAGMARDAGLAELPWLAALASLRIGRWDQARRWAEIAKVHGAGSDAERTRIGFRIVRGLTVGPAEVLEFLREHEAPEELQTFAAWTSPKMPAP